VQNAGPWVDPLGLGADRFVCREFFCPDCATLLDVEIAQRGEPILWDGGSPPTTDDSGEPEQRFRILPRTAARSDAASRSRTNASCCSTEKNG
jgi:hypothetical protein